MLPIPRTLLEVDAALAAPTSFYIKRTDQKIKWKNDVNFTFFFIACMPVLEDSWRDEKIS